MNDPAPAAAATRDAARIGAGFRLALVAKGLLLAALASGFAALPFAAGASGLAGSGATPVSLGAWLVRIALALLAAPLALFLAWAAGLAFLDAARGRTVEESGAVALESRRAGHSLRLTSGRFVEFILWNPWSPLVPDARYRVRYGRHSRVLVAPPEREPREA